MEIVVQPTGFGRLRQLFARLTGTMRNLRPVFDAVVHEFLLDHMSRRFDTGGSYGGHRWAGYGGEPKYRASKKAQGAVMKPLWWKPGVREQLRPSLITARHPLQVWRAGARAARFGTRVPHAARINRGGKNQYGEPAPARKIFSFATPQQTRLHGAIRRFILRTIGVR